MKRCSTRSLLWLLTLSSQIVIAWLTFTLAASAAEPMGLDFTLASETAMSDRPLPAAARPVAIASETDAPPPPASAIPTTTSASSGNISFALPITDRTASPSAPAAPVPAAPPEQTDLFAGDSDSLVAKAIGSAEGTRTPNGGYTWAYQGHVDPGNGAWNQGSFSYQHEASSPQDADRRQLVRLRTQAQILRQQADRYDMTLTLAETLNGIDLANQSPRAALSPGGYIDRLRQAREMGLQSSDAVLWARTRAFLDPNTNRWNAPGLGNNVYSITADQDRRRQAIEQAIEARSQSPSQRQ